MIWSTPACRYATNYSLELFDVETPLEEAAAFAEKGVKLDPGNQRGRLILAYVLLFKDEISAGLAETDRALALNPNWSDFGITGWRRLRQIRILSRFGHLCLCFPVP